MAKISLEKYFIGLSKDSFIYGLGNAFLRIMALITAPIFTRIFLPSEYGIISLVASVISFLSLFLIFGMDNAIFVSFYEYKNERKSVISSAFWFLFSWGLILVLIASALSGQLSQLILKNDSYQTLFLISFWTAFFTLLTSLTKVVFRLEFRARSFALISIINAFLSTALMIVFVVYLKRGLVGYFEGSLIGTFISLIGALYLIRNNLKFQINWLRLKEMLKYGVLVVPASLAYFIFDLSDRFFINHYRSLDELGLYSIGINIASLIVFFSYALGQAWSPQVMKIYFESKKIFREFVPRFFTYYLIFFFTLAVLISLFGQEILHIFTTRNFYGAAQVIHPLTLAMVFSASNQVTSLGISISRKTKYFAIYTLLAALLNIILNFLLIPTYGMLGAGWATAFSYLFLTIAYYFNSQKFIRLKFDWSKIVKIIILGLLVILAGPKLLNYTFWINFTIKCLELALYVLLLYLTGVVEKQEINYLKKYINKIINKSGRKTNGK